MTNDKAYFNEYMGCVEIGVTEAEAVIEAATANEVSVSNVFDALVREACSTLVVLAACTAEKTVHA